MGSGRGFEVTAGDLVAHARSLDRVCDEVAAARNAGSAVVLGSGAYGVLCGWVAGLLAPAQDSAVTALAGSVGALEQTARGLRDSAGVYDAVDAGSSAGFDRMAR